MATRSGTKNLRRTLRNADDILFLFTGKRLKHVVGRGVSLFGEEIARKASNLFTGPEEPELATDSPYTVLGIHPEALDVVVKAGFRALAREYHPDTGTKPDVAKFQVAKEAYDAIMAERLKMKGTKGTG